MTQQKRLIVCSASVFAVGLLLCMSSTQMKSNSITKFITSLSGGGDIPGDRGDRGGSRGDGRGDGKTTGGITGTRGTGGDDRERTRGLGGGTGGGVEGGGIEGGGIGGGRGGGLGTGDDGGIDSGGGIAYTGNHDAVNENIANERLRLLAESISYDSEVRAGSGAE
jgi:hypothetical protein